MNICLCGAEAGYPHDECCPYPLYRGSSHQVIAWEMKWAVNKQAAQPALALDAAIPCAHRFHTEDNVDFICIDCGARTPRQ